MAQGLDDFPGLCILADRARPHRVAQMVDHPDHGLVDFVITYALDQIAVNFQIIDGQMLEIAKGRHTGTKIIKRKRTAELTHPGDELDGLGEVGDRMGLGDLETNLSEFNIVTVKQGLHFVGKSLFTESGTGKVDGKDTLPTGRVFGVIHGDLPESVPDHPAINQRHQAEALGRRDENARRHQAPVFFTQAQQQFKM